VRVAAARRLGRAVLVGWFLLPLLPLLLWAGADRWSFPAVLPQRWGFAGVREALGAGGVAALGRSSLLGLGVALLAVPVGAVAARALVQGRVRLPRTVGVLLLAPLALPPFAVALGLDVALLRARVPGPLGVLLLLTVAAVPYTTYTMRVAWGAYDVAVEDEARTLGAGRRAVLLRVRLPALAPALSGAAFLAFLVGWSDYVVTLLVGGGRLVTVPLLVGSAAAAVGNDSLVAVLSLAAVAPPLLLLVAVAALRRGRT
jgi:putative spermidine/putrescine transport system permease protein